MKPLRTITNEVENEPHDISRKKENTEMIKLIQWHSNPLNHSGFLGKAPLRPFLPILCFMGKSKAKFQISLR